MIVVGFNPKTAEDLIQLVRDKRPIPAPDIKRPPMFLRELDVGTASTEISARSGSTPGSGTFASAERQQYTNGTASGAWTETVFNYFGSSIAADDYVVVARTTTGRWVVIAADCS